MNPLIKVEKLTKSYQQQQVLSHLNFTIKNERILAILGKNGAGKTTLIKILLGMISPTEGNVFYQEKNITSYKNGLYQDFSAVLEAVDNLYPYLTGMQNIHYFLSLQKIKHSNKHKEIEDLVNVFDLQDAIDKKVGGYSRGMQQKLAIICALLSEMKVIFLDEPTLGLDFKANKELISTIKRLAKHHHKTIILTSHQSNVIENLADDILLLDEGKIVYHGTYENFITKYAVDGYYELECNILNQDTLNQFLTDYTVTIRDNRSMTIRTSNKESIDKLIIHMLSSPKDHVYSFGKKQVSIEEILINFYEEVKPK